MDSHSEPWILRARQGDRQAVAHLVHRHLSAVEFYVRLRSGSLRVKEADADVVQSVCRELLEGLGGFAYQGEAAFRSWLFTTARRKIIEKRRYYRSARRDVRRELPPLGPDTDGLSSALTGRPADPQTPSRIAMAREDVARLEAAFGELPPLQREVLLLARIAGPSHEEIAVRLGKTASAVKSLVYRATARLALLLDVE